MEKFKVVEKSSNAWCPGCGNFSILDCLTVALGNLGKSASEVLLVGGIGQAAKTNQYVGANGFSGLHGRALPAAVAAKMSNDKLTVIVNSGDGDTYGEGGNHFIHNIRRNVDISHFVHNNQIYGLTKGQVSPTTDEIDEHELNGFGNTSIPFNPMLMAIAAGATFVARSFSGNPEHLTRMMEAAINHKGYALVDILQPCVTFNKINTFGFYNKKVYELEADYDKSNKAVAMVRAMEFEEKIPIGILYEEEAQCYSQKQKVLKKGTVLVGREVQTEKLDRLLKTFTWTEKLKK